MGRVFWANGYAVDLDDKEMVDHAREAVFEDVCNAVKFDEVDNAITVEIRPDLTVADIASFLVEDHMQEDEKGETEN